MEAVPQGRARCSGRWLSAVTLARRNAALVVFGSVMAEGLVFAIILYLSQRRCQHPLPSQRYHLSSRYYQ